MKLLKLSLIALLFITTACKKDTDEEEEEEEESTEYYIQADINGVTTKYKSAKGLCWFDNPYNPQYMDATSNEHAYFDNQTFPGLSFNFYPCENPPVVKTYAADSDTPNENSKIRLIYSTPSGEYREALSNRMTYDSYIEITKVTSTSAGYVLEGTFSGIVQDNPIKHYTDSIITITNGEFKLLL